MCGPHSDLVFRAKIPEADMYATLWIDPEALLLSYKDKLQNNL